MRSTPRCPPCSACRYLPGLTLPQAATLPETFFTVWLNLFRRAGLQPGETVLVHGGASGIGTTAILLASAFGAQGADHRRQPRKMRGLPGTGRRTGHQLSTPRILSAAVRESTQGRGADVILDMVGGEYVQRNIAAAADGWPHRLDCGAGRRARRN